MTSCIDHRARELFEEDRNRVFRRTDRMFAWLMVAQWVTGIGLAFELSPYTWSGAARSTNPHVWAAILLGGSISALPIALALLRPGWQGTRYVIAVSQMLWSALLIHLTGGRIETHFHVFGSLAFLAFYSDWRVLPVAGAVVVIDHLLRGMFWPESVYGQSRAEWWRVLEHGGWVAYIELFLIVATVTKTRDQRAVARRQAEIEVLSASDRRKSDALERAAREEKRLTADLERRVEERTRALATANANLERSLVQLAETKTKLVSSDRLAAIGHLSAGIAHEINNPLAYITTNLSHLAELVQTRDVDAMREPVADALHGADRVRKIVADLKRFARVDDDRRERVELLDVVESACKFASNEIRHRARLVVSHGVVPRVLGDAGRLGQVFLNLLINAGQSLSRVRPEGHEIRISTSTSPKGEAVVEVEDTGDGIPEKMFSRIFDPFFTTKPIGVGTGLGLSICHGIVAAHGGSITVETQVGRGTRFRVTLPALGEGLEPEPASVRSEITWVRRRVLVVDDEPMILNAVRRTLMKAHEVEAVASPLAALERIRGGDRFDVVLCDLMMPGMTGMQLHAEVAAAAPQQGERFVFLTGGAVTPAAREFVAALGDRCIDKPFDAAALPKVVSKLAARFDAARAAHSA